MAVVGPSAQAGICARGGCCPYVYDFFRVFVCVHVTDGMPGHPHLDKWRGIGQKYKQRWHGLVDPDPEYPLPRNGTCTVQVVRSVSDWSHGVLTEHSIQNACENVTILPVSTESQM